MMHGGVKLARLFCIRRRVRVHIIIHLSLFCVYCELVLSFGCLYLCFFFVGAEVGDDVKRVSREGLARAPGAYCMNATSFFISVLLL